MSPPNTSGSRGMFLRKLSSMTPPTSFFLFIFPSDKFSYVRRNCIPLSLSENVPRRCLAMENGFFPLRRRLAKSPPNTPHCGKTAPCPSIPSTPRSWTKKPACTTTKQGTTNRRCSPAGM